MGNYFGIDISNNNGNVNLSKAKDYGVQMVYMKATEGVGYKDRFLDNFYNQCKQLGLKKGVYHFLTGRSSGAQEANAFWDVVKDYEFELVYMLDVEKNFNGISNYIIDFVNTWKSLTNKELGIYTYTGFMNNIQGASSVISNMKLWEANYNNNPWSLNNNWFTNRIGHQYSENGNVDGIGKCDINYFNDGVMMDNGGQWIKNETGWWYKHGYGTYTSNGWEKIDNKWYYFDGNGYMKTGWISYKGNQYYIWGEEGYMATGWQLLNGNYYYFGGEDDGAMRCGLQYIDGNLYLFNDDGVMQTTEQSITVKPDKNGKISL